MLKNLLGTDKTLVIRTDFENDFVWQQVCEQMRSEVDAAHFLDEVECVSDPDNAGLTAADLMALSREQQGRSFAFIFDHVTVSQPDHPILAVDLIPDEPAEPFRLVPTELWTIHANLSLANMYFDEFADNVDPDGVWRG